MGSKLFLLLNSDFSSMNESLQEEIYREFYHLVYGIAIYIMRDHASAEDIVQEAFIKVIYNAPPIASEHQLIAWIKVVTKNLMLNSLRKNKKVSNQEDKETLDYERELLGLYVSGHPLDDYPHILRNPGLFRLSGLEELEEGRTVRVAGMVYEMKATTTKKGEPMAFITFEDKVGQAEVIVFPGVFTQYRHLLRKDKLLVLEARVNRHEEGSKLIANRVWDIDEVPRDPAVYIKIPTGKGPTAQTFAALSGKSTGFPVL